MLPLLNGYGVMCPEKYLDMFLAICDIHLVLEDDIMIIAFLQTIVGQTFDRYLSLTTTWISYFNYTKDAILVRHSQPIAYHTLLTEFTQIHLRRH